MPRLRRGYGGQAPRLALWILRVRLSAEDREFAIGDLEEEFLDRVERDGPARARRWYFATVSPSQRS